MSGALHLDHLAQVWAKDGPLQASLAQALANDSSSPEMPVRILKAVTQTPPRPAALRIKLETAVDAIIQYLDEDDGDPDFEPEPRELDSDFEPSMP